MASFVPLLTAASPAPAAMAPAEGSALYRQRCIGCHSVEAGRNNPAGPNLAGIVGRQAAAGEFGYSPALRKSKFTWTRAKLDEFLAGPSSLVPGTRMVIGVSNAVERKAIIDYLASCKS
ncbi:MAG: c-type cytochrome [Novosphingobium sp.]|nr:c-type cytochrome [Novosphingobium sp.]